MLFREANYGYIFKKNAYGIDDFVLCQELSDMVNRGIKGFNLPIATDSFNAVKPILRKEFGLYS